jgi:hypothetical protein
MPGSSTLCAVCNPPPPSRPILPRDGVVTQNDGRWPKKFVMGGETTQAWSLDPWHPPPPRSPVPRRIERSKSSLMRDNPRRVMARATTVFAITRTMSRSLSPLSAKLAAGRPSVCPATQWSARHAHGWPLRLPKFNHEALLCGARRDARRGAQPLDVLGWDAPRQAAHIAPCRAPGHGALAATEQRRGTALGVDRSHHPTGRSFLCVF